MPIHSEALFASTRPSNDPFPTRFGLWHVPTTAQGVAAHSLVVHVHAFTEEMNKSRRMVASQSRALAARGHAVLQLDLLGCGDSPGDFSDATWQAWVSDVESACEWALRRFEQTWPGAARPQLWLWGHRTGCLLANAAAALSPAGHIWHQLYWQPQAAGKAVLQQFLRLRLASGLQAGEKRAQGPDPRQNWAAEQPVEIAGYLVSAALAHGLEQAKLTAPLAGSRVIWLEVSARNPASLLPASETVVAQWQEAGASVHAQAVQGPGFWQTTEIEDAPALIAATSAAMNPSHPVAGSAS
jgi:uncharacterized protein